MISREDYETLLPKLDSMKEKNSKLKTQISEERVHKEEIPLIRKSLSKIKEKIVKDEDKFRKEMKATQKKIDSMKDKPAEGKKSFSINNMKSTVQLTTQKMLLSTNQEKLSKSESKIAKLEHSIQNLEALEKPIDEQIEEIEGKMENLDKYLSKIPSAPHLFLEINDLISTQQYFKDVHQLLVKKQERMQKTCESNEEDIKKSNDEIEKLRSELKEINDYIIECRVQADTMNDDSKQKQVDFRNVEDQVVDLTKQKMEITEDIEKIKNEGKETITELNRKYEIINEEVKKLSLNASMEETNRQILKKKTIIDQLKLKIKQQRNQLSEEISGFVDVDRLNIALSEEIKLRQIEKENWKSHLKKLENNRQTLSRKLAMIEELNRISPPGAKIKAEKGMKEFLIIYELAFVQNRDMAQDIRIITSELASVEAEHQQLLRELKNSE